MERVNISTEIRTKNRQLVYKFIRDNEPVTKQDIVVGMDLSLPTVIQILQQLEDSKLIDSSQTIKKTGGRFATAYTYVRNVKLAIGVSITKNHVNVVAVDLSGQVVEMTRERVTADLNSNKYLKLLGDLVEKVKLKANIYNENLLGVGIAVPSLVSDDGEQVIYGLTLNFTGITKDEISKYIPYQTYMFHDSYAAGFSEVWFEPNMQNAFYINLNDSVGGSIIIKNNIFSGDTNRSGEIGHITVVTENGKTCYCGKQGCFDTVCNSGNLDFYTNGNLKEFFDLLKSEDEKALMIWDKYLDYLSLAINNIRMLFDCSIILGGYVGSYIEDFMDELCSKIDARNMFRDRSKTYVLPCKYKVETTAAGAAIILIDDFIYSV